MIAIPTRLQKIFFYVNFFIIIRELVCGKTNLSFVGSSWLMITDLLSMKRKISKEGFVKEQPC